MSVCSALTFFPLLSDSIVACFIFQICCSRAVPWVLLFSVSLCDAADQARYVVPSIASDAYIVIACLRYAFAVCAACASQSHAFEVLARVCSLSNQVLMIMTG